jgi:hypothetical protein
MRKLKFLLIVPIVIGAIFLSSCSKDEDTGGDNSPPFLASMEVEKKAALLEELTGVRCSACPYAHNFTKNNIDNYPGKIVALGIHAGSYAVPAAGWANFTTPYGDHQKDVLNGVNRITGYPAMYINRKYHGKGANQLSVLADNWQEGIDIILSEDAPVNLGGTASFDPTTRELTVTMDLYYTSTETSANNLHVVLLQNGLVAKQSGGSSDYVHNHAVRASLSGNDGFSIPSESTEMGSKFTKTFTFTVPENINGTAVPEGGGAVLIENCEIAAFVTGANDEALNAINVHID